MSSARVVASVALAFVVGSCAARLVVPADAVINCRDQLDCPTDFGCVENLCLPLASDCVVEEGGDIVAAPNQTSCTEVEDGVCLDGQCVARGCGDGVVEGDEQCDEGRHNNDTVPDACRTDCLTPRCGDGVIDGDESCDAVRDDCVACLQLCAVGDADCDKDSGCECSPAAVWRGGFIDAIQLQNNSLFVFAASPAVDGTGLWRIPRGQDPVLLATTTSGALGAFAADDTHVDYSQDALWRISQDGGDPERVDSAFRFALSEGRIFTIEDTVVQRIDAQTLDKEILYDGPTDGIADIIAVKNRPFFNSEEGTVYTIDDGALLAVAERQMPLAPMASDGFDLYWVDDQTRVWRLTLDDEGRSTAAAFIAGDGADAQRGLTVGRAVGDSLGVVFSAADGRIAPQAPSGVLELELGRREPRMRARVVDQLTALTLDASSICWAAAGTVRCIPR